MSRIEEQVIAKIRSRAEVGLNKYGVTLERDDLSIEEWLTHAQEEAMDLSGYLEKTVEEVKTLREYISSLENRVERLEAEKAVLIANSN